MWDGSGRSNKEKEETGAVGERWYCADVNYMYYCTMLFLGVCIIIIISGWFMVSQETKVKYTEREPTSYLDRLLDQS
eukprot:scaffold11051_cov165-Amphora_coffeaeformis.AAC.6